MTGHRGRIGKYILKRCAEVMDDATTYVDAYGLENEL